MNEMTDKERALIVQLKARNEELLKVQKKYGNLKAITAIVLTFGIFFCCIGFGIIGSKPEPVVKTVVQTQLVYVTSALTNVPSTIFTRTPTTVPEISIASSTPTVQPKVVTKVPEPTKVLPIPTKIVIPVPDNPSSNPVRTGAVCKDGTSSSATGRGACSGHGGVSCWNYSDGSCRKK